ncbi:type II toxin-antitoxin system RelE/ParE family toxin [Collinsella ihumii]|uniref:type II toxin-antitoxin system RelE/ParE family toxin n=1 Tax=Collinsella ihumii TaxID=1720204 RepID=UPI0025AB2CA4|nr:type II toxin-antitoxin system YafQ family toxin [Collinsella ihumii]MDN0055219.1 type II toxin-antitoxin system YafQ family toxin [Collinsella ihumii]
MYEVKPEPQFQTDYRRVMREHPELKPEFRAAVRELMQTGSVSEQYRPHVLQNPGGNYNGHIDFHLSDGKTDVIVLYVPHKTNPI